ITVTAQDGFAGVVSLTDTVPTGLTCSAIAPTSVTGSGTATVVCSSTVAGNYVLSVIGASGTLSHTATATFTVILPTDFSISASPATQTGNIGSTATFAITVSPINGGSGTVNLSASAPAAVSCSPNPNSLTMPPSPGTAILTCSSS